MLLVVAPVPSSLREDGAEKETPFPGPLGAFEVGAEEEASEARRKAFGFRRAKQACEVLHDPAAPPERRDAPHIDHAQAAAVHQDVVDVEVSMAKPRIMEPRHEARELHGEPLHLPGQRAAAPLVGGQARRALEDQKAPSPVGSPPHGKDRRDAEAIEPERVFPLRPGRRPKRTVKEPLEEVRLPSRRPASVPVAPSDLLNLPAAQVRPQRRPRLAGGAFSPDDLVPVPGVRGRERHDGVRFFLQFPAKENHAAWIF